jgi:ATP-binding cassette subfamily F protein 3
MLFRLSEVYKSYGSQDVLRGASLQINPGEHVGLVGRNGAGKTTIFRMVSGEETPDEGDVVKARGVRLGLLSQHVHFAPGATVHEAALAAFGSLQQIEHEMRELEHKMSDAGAELDAVLERYAELQYQFEHEGGFEFGAKAESILQGMGFERDTWQMEVEHLSGGQQNRLGMVCLLLAEPEVLLLDEPTNHLDVNAVEWLEEFLQTYAQSYVVVSHDRYFLDRVCNRIIEIELGKAVSYTGNYSAFLIEREERREAQQRAYENQQHLINKTQEFIRKNLAGQKTKQAKARRNMLQRMDKLESVRPDQSSGDFRMRDIERTGNQVLMVNEAAIGYPGLTLATDITFTLLRGECLGIIGPNGSGKTTFLKAILGKLDPQAGEIRWGSKVEIGYYAQQLDDLDDRNEIIMELRRVAAPSATAGELRGFLAKFLFVGDDVQKLVRDLSGGEKGRLALAKLIYSKVNVLVLDEPTNHLDIPSREALEAALDAYPGTILTISHDRYFLDRIATQILALDGAGGAEHYDGDYTEYHDWKAARKQAASAAARQVVEIKAAAKAVAAAPSKSAQSPGKKKQKGGKGAERSPTQIESDIALAEQKLAELSEAMARPEVARDPKKLREANTAYQAAEKQLQQLYVEWESSSVSE